MILAPRGSQSSHTPSPWKGYASSLIPVIKAYDIPSEMAGSSYPSDICCSVVVSRQRSWGIRKGTLRTWLF